MVQAIAGDADACIRDREANRGVSVCLFVRGDTNDHFPFLRELDSVACEVKQDLPQPSRVPAQP